MAIAVSGTPQLTGSGSTTVTSYSANLPTGTNVGDLIILAVSANTTGTGTDPAQTVTGFTAITGGSSGKTGTPYHRLSFFYRWKLAGDGSTAAVNLAAAGNAVAAAVAYSGVDNTTPFVSGEILAQPQGASSTSWSTGNITTAAARWIISAFANRTSGTWSGNADTTRLSGIAASSANILYQDSNANVAATTTGRTATYSVATSVGNTVILSLNPASGANASGTGTLTYGGTATATASASGTAILTITAVQNPSSANASGVASLTVGASGTASAAASGSGSLTIVASAATPIVQAVTSGAKVYVAHHACFASTLGEGTLESYQAALAQDPFALLELPVWKTTDGFYVVSHDRTTGRVFSGTSVDITTVAWSAISSYTSINGGNLIRRLQDITAAIPNGLYVIDNKQDTGAAALITKLDSLIPGRWMGKQAQSASGTWLTSCQNDGVPVWGYFYPADLTTTNFNNYTANLSNSKSPVLVGLGDFSAAPIPVQSDSNTFWTWANTNGFRAWAHILQTAAQKSNADTQAATAGGSYSGYMVSGFATVAPTYVSGAGQLSIVSSGSAAAMVSGTGILQIDALPFPTLTVSTAGQAFLEFSGLASIAGAKAFYLYTPPIWYNIGVMEGSLRYKIPTSTTTYRLNGTWYNVQSPGMGITDGADYVFCTPTEIDATLAQEMLAANVPGTFS